MDFHQRQHHQLAFPRLSPFPVSHALLQPLFRATLAGPVPLKLATRSALHPDRACTRENESRASFRHRHGVVVKECRVWSDTEVLIYARCTLFVAPSAVCQATYYYYYPWPHFCPRAPGDVWLWIWMLWSGFIAELSTSVRGSPPDFLDMATPVTFLFLLVSIAYIPECGLFPVVCFVSSQFSWSHMGSQVPRTITEAVPLEYISTA